MTNNAKPKCDKGGTIFLLFKSYQTMEEDMEEDKTIYKVVLNHEEQYSIWPANRENPLGWMDTGFSGNRIDCMERIKQIWTDMRPLSLRKAMGEIPD